jgi:hypothetical protein
MSLKPRSHSALRLDHCHKALQNVISRETDKIKQIRQNNQIDYIYFLIKIIRFDLILSALQKITFPRALAVIKP